MSVLTGLRRHLCASPGWHCGCGQTTPRTVLPAPQRGKSFRSRSIHAFLFFKFSPSSLAFPLLPGWGRGVCVGCLPQLHPSQGRHAFPSPVPSQNFPKHHIYPTNLGFFSSFSTGGKRPPA